jgi:hypothetical protein
MLKKYLVPVSCTGRLNSYNIPFFERYPHKMNAYNEIVRGSNENPELLGGLIILDSHILCFSEYDCKEDAKIETLCQAFHNVKQLANGSKICIPSYMADAESVQWLCKMYFKNWEVSNFV